MPNRILKESICVSDSIDKLSWFEEVLYYRLIVNCDDFGRFDGRPSIIKNRLFPLKENLTVKAVAAAINKLASAELVSLYVFEGKPYLYLPSWNEHQTIRAKRSKYPEPVSNLKADEIICKQMQANVPAIQSESESYSVEVMSNDITRSSDAERAVDLWNSIPSLQPIRHANADSKRGKMLRARISEYGIDAVLQAIQRIPDSDFLIGQGSNGWVITFDWFVKPTNFLKVLEGNYDNRRSNHHEHSNPFLELLEEEANEQN